MEREQENIDLQKLSQKELLIVTYRKVEELTGSVAKITEKQEGHEVRIAVIESRVMMWGALFGMLAAGLIEGILAFIKH
jgi:hypothetical protein